MGNTIMSICFLLIVFSIYQLQKQIKILICLVGDIFKYIKEQKTEKDNKSLHPTPEADAVSHEDY